jgi:purine-binding chemotaxis protein CheW
MAQNLQFCTFYLDRLLFGIPLTDVQEVMRHTDMTRVPLAPSVVSGLINLRGQIVTAVDLRQKLEFAPQPEDKPPMNVVVHNEEGAVSLLVDEIGDVVEVGQDAFEPPPETLRGKVRSVILGVYKLSGQLMHVVDTAKACEIAEAVENGTTPAN